MKISGTMTLQDAARMMAQKDGPLVISDEMFSLFDKGDEVECCMDSTTKRYICNRFIKKMTKKKADFIVMGRGNPNTTDLGFFDTINFDHGISNSTRKKGCVIAERKDRLVYCNIYSNKGIRKIVCEELKALPYPL